jgi:hypothetical protein
LPYLSRGLVSHVPVTWAAKAGTIAAFVHAPLGATP